MKQKTLNWLRSSTVRAAGHVGLAMVCALGIADEAQSQPSSWGSKKQPTQPQSNFDSFGFSKPEPAASPAATASPSTEELDPTSDRVLRAIRQTQAATGNSEEAEATPSRVEPTLTKRDTTALLPKDQRFWEWASWYQEHGVISLIVDGRDRTHMLEQLVKLAELRKRKRVAIGQVVIVGGGANLTENTISAPKNVNARIVEDPVELRKTLRVAPTEFGALCDALDLSPTSQMNSEQIINHFGVSNSPTWVVRYQGRDYVFEGPTEINRLFTVDGRFVR